MADLQQWSIGRGLTPVAARRAVSELGRTLFRRSTATAEPGPESGDDSPPAGGRRRDLATAV